jgi:diguanylate cyclase (GGDEF)-like protein
MPISATDGVPFQVAPALAPGLLPASEVLAPDVDVPAGAVDQSLLDGLAWPAVLLDSSGRVALANRAWWRRMAVGRGAPGACGPGADYLNVCRRAAQEMPELTALIDALEEILRGERASYVYDYQVKEDPDGERWFSAHCTPVGHGPDGVLVAHVDVTDRVKAISALAEAAAHDELTGLANRSLFLDRLRTSLDRGEPLAVIFLDLDDFKLINDTLGHGIGDRLLIEVAQRLRAAVRPGDLVARLGGDEFTILCRGVHDTETAHVVAGRVHNAFETPFAVGGQARHQGVSIGCRIAVPGAGESADALLRDADVALYQAKGRGKDRVELFSERTRARLVRRLEIEHELRRAVDSGALEVRYQPQVDLVTCSLVGVEALARWSHPGLGVVSPAEFVSVAEERGLIMALGTLVLERLCHQLATWRKQPDMARMSATVNVSVFQLADPNFAERVLRAVDSARLDCHALCLEVTESALVGAGEGPLEQLHRLREQGLYVAIDDFGTGFSSLAQLKRLPVDVLKIDRAFVDGLGTDAEDTAIVASILSMAHAMGLHVIAEGVETSEQAVELLQLGCGVAQGFLFSAAVTAADIPLLAARKGSPLRRDAIYSGPGRQRGANGLIEELMVSIGLPESSIAVPAQEDDA